LSSIIKLSELWGGLSTATEDQLHNLAEFENTNENAIGDAWERHYYSYRFFDDAVYAADAIWDAVFVVAYRNFITARKRERGLSVFKYVFCTDAKSLVDILLTVADASDEDFITLSSAWADINDYGESAEYQAAIQACNFPFPSSITDHLSDEESILVYAGINNLLIAGNSAIAVTSEDYKMMIEPVWQLLT
jgi:hypothetical protein